MCVTLSTGTSNQITNALIVFRMTEEGEKKVIPGVACDIGRRGVRIKTDHPLIEGASIQVSFPNSPDHINCFGRAVWCHPPKMGVGFETGIEVNAWHGITEGEYSYRRFLNNRARTDRRTRPR